MSKTPAQLIRRLLAVHRKFPRVPKLAPPDRFADRILDVNYRKTHVQNKMSPFRLTSKQPGSNSGQRRIEPCEHFFAAEYLEQMIKTRPRVASGNR